MKKILLVFLLALTCLFAGCAEIEKVHNTADASRYYIKYQKGYLFEIGERVEIYEKESHECVCSLVIKNATIINKNPGRQRADNGDSVYPESVVQVNYEVIPINKSFAFDNNDLIAFDFVGVDAVSVSAKNAVYTEYNMVAYAVQNTGDYIDIGICIDSKEPIGTIRAYYDVGEIEENPLINDVLWSILLFCILVLIVLIICYKKLKIKHTYLLEDKKYMDAYLKRYQATMVNANQEKNAVPMVEQNGEQTENTEASK